MEIAIGLVGLSLTAWGVLLTYMWRTNGRYIRELQAGQKELQAGQKELQTGQKEIAEGIKGLTRLGRIMALYYWLKMRRREIPQDMQDIFQELEKIVRD